MRSLALRVFFPGYEASRARNPTFSLYPFDFVAFLFFSYSYSKTGKMSSGFFSLIKISTVYWIYDKLWAFILILKFESTPILTTFEKKIFQKNSHGPWKKMRGAKLFIPVWEAKKRIFTTPWYDSELLWPLGVGGDKPDLACSRPFFTFPLFSHVS